MRKEVAEKLYQVFPALYSNRADFECGEGWFDLIYRLSERITKIVAEKNLDPNMVVAWQVKEKFAELRFYMSGCNKEMSEAIKEAELESIGTCETCGAGGILRLREGWLETSCLKCVYEYIKTQQSYR
ncbi:hypothetical protein M011DRAFT_484065 [Sporormia fimetaria CBS 119925]|uniref:Uncharacterized protein n=1 Tax=Sporormia fimetaria CBS 119925 TaxID=1340428 RepID=A0A6A6VM31_9PLEO|nr:hypothetical protein M011DRAFT_484065 [Sporormia fimetaria CBS 119925]